MDILRNEALRTASQIVQNSLAAAPAEVRDGYQQGAETPPVLRFTEEVKAQIGAQLRQDYATVEPRLVSQVVGDAQAGV
jgi:hypothetical protein